MAEYAGYVSSKPIDWTSISQGLQESIQRGTEARQKKIDEDIKLTEQGRQKLGSFESTQSPTYNNIVFKGLEGARNQMKGWHDQMISGQMSRQEYKMKMNSIMESFDSFSMASKNFDQYITAVKDKIDKGEASSLFVAKANANQDLMNLNQGELLVDNNGNFLVNVGGNLTGVQQWTNFSNLSDEKLNLPDAVKNGVSNWESALKETLSRTGSVSTFESVKAQDDYKVAKENTISAILNNNDPTRVVSILTDNSNLGYEIYNNQSQVESAVNNALDTKKRVLGRDLTDAEAKEVEKSVTDKSILLIPDGNGNLQPQVTQKMIDDARDVTGKEIEMQLGVKQEVQRGFSNGGGGGDGGGDQYSSKNDDTLYSTMATAWNSGDHQKLQSLLKNRNYQIESVPGKGARIIQYNKDMSGNIQKDNPTVVHDYTKNLFDLTPYFFGTGATAVAKAKKQRELWLKSGGNSGGSNPSEKSSTVNKAPRG